MTDTVAAASRTGRPIPGAVRRLPETELKYLVGLVLTSFGTFFAAEGLGVDWPLGDAALLALVALYFVASQLMAGALARGRGAAVGTPA